MDKIEQEKENIILLSIARYGYAAMPKDYHFLLRYSMLNIYYEILDRSLKGKDTNLLEADIKKNAAAQVPDPKDFSSLQEYKQVNGSKETKKFLCDNNYYWRMLLIQLKKKNRKEKLDY